MQSDSNPLLSIIMPVYNAEKYLSEAIEGILAQSFENFELIIGDDGSSDRSKRIIDSIQSNRIIANHNDVNQGKTKIVNRLFLLAKGKYLTIHDADDISHPERFKIQIDFLERNPDIGICGCGFITIDRKGNEFSRAILNKTHKQILADAPNKSQFHGPTVVVRRKLVHNLDSIYRSYFNDNYEDIDFCYRILSQSKGYNINEYLYYYRILPNSLCRRNVDIKNRNLYKVVYWLFEQRKNGNPDCLTRNKIDELEKYFGQITKKYEYDISLIHREAASYYMFWRLYGSAVKASIRSISLEPYRLINWRTLIYCIRKATYEKICKINFVLHSK